MPGVYPAPRGGVRDVPLRQQTRVIFSRGEETALGPTEPTSAPGRDRAVGGFAHRPRDDSTNPREDSVASSEHGQDAKNCLASSVESIAVQEKDGVADFVSLGDRRQSGLPVQWSIPEEPVPIARQAPPHTPVAETALAIVEQNWLFHFPNTLGATRTRDPQFRKPVLYPPELRGQLQPHYQRFAAETLVENETERTTE